MLLLALGAITAVVYEIVEDKVKSPNIIWRAGLAVVALSAVLSLGSYYGFDMKHDGDIYINDDGKVVFNSQSNLAHPGGHVEAILDPDEKVDVSNVDVSPYDSPAPYLAALEVDDYDGRIKNQLLKEKYDLEAKGINSDETEKRWRELAHQVNQQETEFPFGTRFCGQWYSGRECQHYAKVTKNGRPAYAVVSDDYSTIYLAYVDKLNRNQVAPDTSNNSPIVYWCVKNSECIKENLLEKANLQGISDGVVRNQDGKVFSVEQCEGHLYLCVRQTSKK